MDLNRTEMVLGKEFLNHIRKKSVIVFGIGGVGGAAVEALCRLGLEKITFVDRDIVEASNVNRQIIATKDTMGKDKVQAMRERLLSINPTGEFTPLQVNVTKDWVDHFDFRPYDAILDCIDTVSGKLALYEGARRDQVYLLSSMGTGNKLDPTKLVHTTIEKTKHDPLARVIRRECRKRNLNNIEVIYSTELPTYGDGKKLQTPGSTPFVPPSAGILMASILCRKWYEKIDSLVK
ncbi:MAG: ThiF family adenylyltransferase [Tissierellia bacterium]|nr:ThiF family adenylyltransferase [Tissierellia bacterium]